jgi:hypothetical protein
MIRRVARFVTRPNLEGIADLGIIMPCIGQSELQGGKVYEIIEVLGELLVREVGDTFVGQTINQHVFLNFCWGNDIGSVLRCAGKDLALSKDEYLEIHPNSRKE